MKIYVFLKTTIETLMKNGTTYIIPDFYFKDV